MRQHPGHGAVVDQHPVGTSANPLWRQGGDGFEQGDMDRQVAALRGQRRRLCRQRDKHDVTWRELPVWLDAIPARRDAVRRVVDQLYR
ncbi:hypothetical protein D9M68_926650 [compost metagenome]